MGGVRWGLLGRMAGLLLLWCYVLLAAGGLTGLLNFRLRVFSLALGALVVAAWLLPALRRRQRLETGGMGWTWLALLAGQAVALLFSADPRRGLPTLAMWLAYALVFFVALAWLRRPGLPLLIENMFLLAGGILLGFALLDLVQNFLYWRGLAEGLPYAPPFTYRLYSVVGDANLLAACVNLLIVLAAARLLGARLWPARIGLALYLLAAITVEWFADSRGGLLGLAAALMTLGACWAWPSLRHWRPSRADLGRAVKWVVPAVLLLALLAVGLAPRILRLGGDATHGPALSARDVFWGAAARAFADEPLTGLGPGLYPAALAAYSSTPPDRPYLHAHSWPVTFAAESGLAGLAGLAVFAAGLVWRVWRRLRTAGPEMRSHWAAAAAALAGLAVHSQADYFMHFAAVALPALYFLAVVASAAEPDAAAPRLHPGWLAAVGLALLAFGIYDLRGVALAESALAAAERGDWPAAAAGMQAAAEADPALAHYPLQAAYAWARAGENAAALDALTRGMAREPIYALNHANRSALLAAGGQPVEALAAMETAAALAPESAEFAFWLGLARRAAGDEAGAGEAFARYQALAAGNLRAQTLNAHFERARAAIAAGDLASAEAELAAGREFYAQSPTITLGFAELAVARGDLEAARRYLLLALHLPAVSNAEKVEPILYLGNVLLAQGDEEAARTALFSGYIAIQRASVQGWGAAGWTPYPWLFFLRAGFAEEVTPGLIRQPVPPHWLDLLAPLPLLLDSSADPAADEVRAFLASAAQPSLP